MGDATVRPSTGDDLVVQNDDGSAKIELNEDGTVTITGTVTLPATSFGDGNITNVADLNCDSVSVDDATVGLDLNFGGNNTLNKVSLTDNLADALNINQGGTSYMKFVTTDSSEAIVAGKDLETLTTTKIKQKGAFMQSSTHQALTLGV